MADENPTGEGYAVALKIPAGNMPFLRCVIGAARDGLRHDLNRFGDRLDQPRSRLLFEDAAYSTLLDGLDRGSIVPDHELRTVLARLAESIDRGNEYNRVVAEHEATHGVLVQLEGGTR